MSIPNSISFDTISTHHNNTFGNYGLYWVSGGTVGAAYNGTDTIIYDFRAPGQYQGRTIKYVGDVWSDDNLSAFPDTVVTNSNSATITLQTQWYGTVSFTFTNPFYNSSGSSTLSVVPTEFTRIKPTGVSSVDGPGKELYYTIAKAEPSGSYHIYLDDQYLATITHTTGQVSAGQTAGSHYGKHNKLYYGQVMTSSSLNTIVAEYIWRTGKCHRNFW